LHAGYTFGQSGIMLAELTASAATRSLFLPRLFNTNVLPALTVLRTSHIASGCGGFANDADVDNMTGGASTDELDAGPGNLLRDVRVSESETMI